MMEMESVFYALQSLPIDILINSLCLLPVKIDSVPEPYSQEGGAGMQLKKAGHGMVLGDSVESPLPNN